MTGNNSSNKYEQMINAMEADTTTKPQKSVFKRRVKVISIIGVIGLIVSLTFFSLLVLQLRTSDGMLLEMKLAQQDRLVLLEAINTHLMVAEQVIKTNSEDPDPPLHISNRSACPSNIGPRSSCFHPDGFSCYCIAYFTKTWKGAKEHCSRTKGFSLVAIESKEEDRILHSFLKTEVVYDRVSRYDVLWTSGTDKDNEGHWIWESTGQAINNYTHWCPGEPNNSNNATEHYLHKQLGNGGCWNDLPGHRTEKFMCEMPIAS